MRELQHKLEKAIEEQRYEDAAEIQKQIEELKQLYKSFFEDN
jgi:protein-arginine kinase activator protein McsA